MTEEVEKARCDVNKTELHVLGSPGEIYEDLFLTRSLRKSGWCGENVCQTISVGPLSNITVVMTTYFQVCFIYEVDFCLNGHVRNTNEAHTKRREKKRNKEMQAEK